MLALMIVAAASQPPAQAQAAPHFCETYLGKKPVYADFAAIVAKLASVTRGKFEKTSEFELRLGAVRRTLPAKAIFRVDRVRFPISYDADTEKLSYDMAAYGLAESYNWMSARLAYGDQGGSIPQSAVDGMSFNIRTFTAKSGSYLGSNAFGATRRVQKRELTSWLLHDPSLEEEGNATFSGSFTPSDAKKLSRAPAALIVDLQKALAFSTLATTQIPTDANLLDEKTRFQVLIGTVECAFLLDESGAINDWWDLEEVRKK
ncbi:hypothetical protein [Sphingomonas sp. LHG3406-1]|uniref:hypothetical protein n=1 Tax=Sphingomonas sp. LHG3406-1 TaxID=2804617 RepID=UPI0026160AF4|nr:hypothetical protein [Sphingomonas sp. LHG3406-1]